MREARSYAFEGHFARAAGVNTPGVTAPLEAEVDFAVDLMEADGYF